MNTIQNYIEFGIIREAAKVKMNIDIWKLIAGNVPKLKQLNPETQALFIYLQQSAQTNFILGISKIFETPRKKYPTKCIRKILEIIPNHPEDLRIQKPTTVLKMQLQRIGCQEDFISSIMDSSKSMTETFCAHYRTRLEDKSIVSKLDEVFFARDKFEAHNEFQNESSYVETENIIELTNLANEFSESFNVLFAKELYVHNTTDFSTYFIHHAINAALK